MSLHVTRLRCEHREDTPLVDGKAPRFGWTLQAEGRDRRQSGYRILVATHADLLANQVGDLWDSGMVQSPETVAVPYGGRELPPESEIVWTVRVFDEGGEPSAWAEPARFRTALASWRASWISYDRRRDLAAGDSPGPDELEVALAVLPPAVYLRRAFAVRQVVSRATLYATARGILELELNGERVGDAVLAPGWTDYEKRIEYMAHDVTDLIRVGDNALGAILGDGWYAGYVGGLRKRLGALYGFNTSLLSELHLEFEGGGKEVVCSDGSWLATTRGPIRYADLLQGESHDARMNLGAWSEPGFDDGDWQVVALESRGDAKLVPAQAPPIRVIEELSPVSNSESDPGVHVFDLGQNMVGWVRLATEGAAGTRVRLRFGEVLDASGVVYQDNLRSARQADTFILRGQGVEVFEPRFTYHGFRYVEVSGLPQPPDEGTLTGCVVHCDMPASADFSCSAELVNRLYSNVVWTQRGNFLSVPTDNPQRDERAGWLGDAQLFLPTASLNMDVAAFMTKWGDDLLDAQSPEGAYPDLAPDAPCITGVSDGAPGYADAGVIVPWTLYRRYGDLRLLERHWPHMERFMDLLLRQNPDLLRREGRNGDYGDWLSIDQDTPRELFATAYWARCATLMARMGRALNRRDRVQHYDRLAAGIARAFQAEFIRDDGLVEGDTQTGYLLALAFDLMPAELASRAAERLVENIERRDWHLATGIHGTALLCPVLTRMGRADVAHRLLLQETFPSWGHTIRHGATTIWECWDGYTEEEGFRSPIQNSLNQYTLGSVGAWLIEALAGIRCADDRVGYEHVVLEPFPGDLSSAHGSYRSVRGEIVSDWERQSAGFRYSVTVPPNVSATVCIPVPGETLTEHGHDAAQAEGVHSVSREKDGWRVEVGSGSYVFVSA